MNRFRLINLSVLLLAGCLTAPMARTATPAPTPPAGSDARHVPDVAALPALPPVGTRPSVGWQISRVAPGDCVGRRSGRRVDTMVMLNRAGTLVLIAGQRTWRLPRGPQSISLSIDTHHWSHVSALSLQTLVMVLVSDPSMLGQLEQARRLGWALPAGRDVSADVSGLGQVVQTLERCRRQSP